MRIPFDIKYRDKIESGEYKVETRDGRPARIICWDIEYYYPQYKIGALIKNDEGEDFFFLTEKGYFCIKESGECDSNNDLFIVTPEKEKLTPFEVAVKSWMGVAEDIVIDDSWVKNCAQELLSLAREEFAKEYKGGSEANEKTISAYCSGYEAGKAEALKDLDGTGKVHCKSYDKGYDDGKKEALKDLPRWIPNKFDKHNFETCKAYLDTPRYLCYQDKMIDVSDLVEKLPKEDEE